MKLYGQVLESVVIQLSWDALPKQEPNWYEIEREPLPDESLVYDAKADSIKIVPRVKTADEIATELKAKEDAELMKADTIRDLQARVAELEKRIMAIDKGSTA